MSRYTVVSIQKSPAPHGQSGDNWYRYEISGGATTIIGYRRGTLGEARVLARECVIHLNTQLTGMPAGEFVRRTVNPVADVDPLVTA
ncbi:hypothetical protein [Thiohalophilus thiocyanatoxydans]|uniref:Uncharacterized protein n=1 Tax=Thiohalophilus thiocyanatoxydans TaxID=381308 RepID=A0A4R8IKP0_9GAMM|nr:hypothetical protein [Thiohalophilus thiocyanatoxydans]TDY00938.1 hypothetical protein EDC23_1683 [Thiohalophilus thiocyanatoxydans]